MNQDAATSTPRKKDVNPCYLAVVDKTALISPSYFKTVFLRDPERTAHIPLYKWIYYCLLEIFFGEELLENIVIIASKSSTKDAPDPEGKFGQPLQLSLQIPAGIFTNLFRKQLVELLYYKFHHQYMLLEPIADVFSDPDRNHWDVSSVRFRMKKDLLYQVIAFRRVYLAEALALNLILDGLMYAVTQSGDAALAAAFVVEAVRRLMKL